MGPDDAIPQEVLQPAAYRYGEGLPPDSEMLAELLEGPGIQELFEAFYTLVNIPVAVIDLKANVLLSSRWRRICVQYHRVHPETCARCIESDTELVTKMQEGKPYAIYDCRNGMTDCAAPIVLEGRHIANLFIGQFLTREPDEAAFRRQGEACGFDLEDYLAALHEVPVIAPERIPAILDLLARMTGLITNLALDRKRALEGQARQSLILDTIPQSVFWKDLEGRYLGCNAAFAKAAGLVAPEEVVGKTDFDLPWPREEAEAYRADDRAVLASGRPRRHIQEPLQQADGSRLVIDTSKAPIVDTQGRPQGILGIYEDITDQERKARELRDAEARFRTLSEGALVGIDIIQDNRFVYVNPAFARTFGYEPGELVDQDPLTVIHPDDHQLVQEQIRKRTSGELPWAHYEFRGRRKDGGIRNIEVFSTRITLNDRPALLANLLDITERKEGERALGESEAYRQAIFDSARDAIVVLRKDRFVDCNPAALALFGASREELVGASPVDFSPPRQPDGRPSPEAALEHIGAALLGVPQAFEWQHVRADQTIFDTEVSLSRVEGLEGEPLIIGIVRDISARKKAVAALRESESRFRALSDNALTGVYIVQDGRLTYVNEAMAEIFGYRPSELMGVDALTVIDPADQALVAENMQRRLSGKVQSMHYEFRGRRKHGGTPIIEVYGSRVDLGNRPAIVGNLLDVTERRQARESLEQAYAQAKRTLDDTIATMAKIVEMRDPYTAGHQARVARLAVAIAREMGLEEGAIDQLRMAATIHDIGKINIGAEILSKPGRLSGLEMQLIMTHAQSGYEIVRNMNFLPEVAQTILQHHERLDGSGYPQGLRGEEIRLEARILAVADVVEAMASHRPYRPARGVEAALEEVEKLRGRHFDPAASDACLKLFREQDFRLDPDDELKGTSEGQDLKPPINQRVKE